MLTIRTDRRLVIAVALAAILLATLLPAVTPAADAQTPVPAALFDGNPATTQRLDASDPVSAAVQVSRTRFPQTAPYAVLATTDTFADSLAGAALTAGGPLLLTGGAALDQATRDELGRVLAPGATVHVLGGEQAIGTAVTDALTADGFAPSRLAGETRVETALAVADEVLRTTPSTTVVLARAEGAEGNPTSAWADSMPGGALAAAAGLPLLVTPTDGLHPAVTQWLAANATTRTVLLGGTAALSDAVASAVPNPARLAGPERTATAAAIAASPLWPRSTERRHLILDGGRPDGWAFGLAAAGIAADAGAPPLLVVGTVTPETRRLVAACGDPLVDLLLVGDTSVISTAVEQTLTDLDGGSCADAGIALRSFPDCQRTLAHFVEEGLARVGPYGLDGHWYGAPEILIDQPAEDEATDGGQPVAQPAPPASPAAPGEDSADGGGMGGGDDAGDVVSETNVQEEGVDEPDMVKATARAAYVATYGTVEVVDLTGTAPARRTPLDVEGFDHQLLLHDDVLVVLTAGAQFSQPAGAPPPDTAFAPDYYYPEPITRLTRFDVSDPLRPVLLDAAEYDGAYRSARMVDGVVRLVASANPTGLDFTFPADGSQQAHDAALAHNRQVIQQSTISDWLPGVRHDGGEDPAVPCGQVFAPPGFSGIATALVASIDVTTSSRPTSSAAVIAQAETLYASTQRLVISSSRWGSWGDVAPQEVTTEVHSFDIADPAATRYVASGQVDGYVLNSFAISERNAYYRIATTTQPPWRSDGTQQQTDNGITVLTEGGGQLFEVGRVFGLGLGERIFAVRYLGDLAAVVTFEQVDPLYLVDLTNPAAPRVTGELKIPGVSRYLHPLGPNHLLGVGQDGTDDGFLTGVQVSLFDISDRARPTRVASLEYGPGVSAVEFDHKAFLLWAQLNRAFVPAELYQADQYGAQAIDIDTAAGTLTRVGALEQPRPEGYPNPVQRTFVVGQTVYAVGFGGVSAHDLTTLADRGFAAFPGDPCCSSEPDQPSEVAEPSR